jgi:hypothetical protein
MSRRIGKQAVLEQEPDSTCELCGAVEETRPYGPNGERICFCCGMRNEGQTKRAMRRVLFGELDS